VEGQKEAVPKTSKAIGALEIISILASPGTVKSIAPDVFI